jgi:U3 small nucleolar RNA-associated protein 20
MFCFRLLKALAHDLRTTMMPMYLPIIQELLPLLLRKLNPAASEELLATLLAIFKYILIPSLPSAMLRDTWRQLRHPFIESSKDGRRMLGEVWGAVIRRLPSDERTKLVSMMLYSLLEEPELRDSIAWAFVAACQVGRPGCPRRCPPKSIFQSPSRSLHQCTSALLSDCIDVHLTTEDPSETGTVLRRILTSFNHHVPGPEQYQPVSNVIVERLQAIVSSLDSNEPSSDHLKRMFALAETPCVVRNGSRMKREFRRVWFCEEHTLIAPFRGANFDDSGRTDESRHLDIEKHRRGVRLAPFLRLGGV